MDKGIIDLKICLENKTLKVRVKGSKLFDSITNYKTEFKEFLSKENDKEKITEFLFSKLKQNLNNPYSYNIGMNIMFKNQSNREVLSQLMTLFNTQNETTKNHYTSDLFLNTLKSKLSSGNINISDFKFLNSNDKENEISFENNDFILIDFWHTACPPCIKDHITMKSLVNNFKEKKIRLISISSDQGKRVTTWKKYLKSKDIPWANYIEKQTNSLTDYLNIRIFPTYILLNEKNDIVIYTNSLDEVLAELKIEK